MAGFDVANFRSVISEKGIARPNRFLCRFNLPAGLLGVPGFEWNVETVRYLEYWAESAKLPQFGLGTHSAQRYGYGAPEKRPYVPVYQDMMINFLFDEYGDNWQLFYDWMNVIINSQPGRGINATDGRVNNHGTGSLLAYEPWEVAYRVEYVTDLNIKIFAQEGEVIKSIILREAFPIGMGDIDLNWNDNNSMLRCPIMFSYVDWQHGSLTDE